MSKKQYNEEDFSGISDMLEGKHHVIPIVSNEDEEEAENTEVPDTLPILTLRSSVLFPGSITPITVGRQRSMKLIRDVEAAGGLMGAVLQKEPEVEQPGPDDLYRVGTAARILKILEMPNGNLTVILHGLEKVEIKEYLTAEPYFKASVAPLKDSVPERSNIEFDALVDSIKDVALGIINISPNMPKEAAFAIKNIDSKRGIINFICSNIDLPDADRQRLLEAPGLLARARRLLEILIREQQLVELKNEIQTKVKQDIDQQQRDYFLQQQMRTIQDELGGDPADKDIDELRKKAEKKQWKDETKELFFKELGKLERMNPAVAEYSVQLNYLQLMAELPWEHCTTDNLDLNRAKKRLDSDHFGLEEVKDRILEHLAVIKLKGDLKSPILCLYGPPGVGKTSLGKSVAAALKRKFGRISLGGLHDESEIRGHRRTYIGAMPGRIITGLKSAGVKNPLMLLDEIDKMSSDYKGDTASAMLEVLDSEQNHKFRDHYVELPVDLSEVLFIASANSMQDIPGPLLDRMEIIEVSSYTENEKFHIAKDHLLAKQFEKNGVADGKLKITDKALRMVISSYTREAGVRSLERQIGEICRKAARRIYEGDEKMIRVTGTNLEDFLGKLKYRPEKKNKKNEVGIVRGLAWTSVGGVTLEIEVNLMPGKGSVVLTGKLGDVMKESAQTGISYIRSISEDYHIDPEFFQKHDIHIHVPEGAVPKDGPSAGITMATAILSAVTGKPVRADVAMTGEITLRGRVLPIGGLKEKLLAAKNAGMKTVCIPKENEQDLAEISEEIVGDMEIIPVEHMDQVIKAAFV